jgi:hypothetical protein
MRAEHDSDPEAARDADASSTMTAAAVCVAVADIDDAPGCTRLHVAASVAAPLNAAAPSRTLTPTQESEAAAFKLAAPSFGSMP